MKLTFSAIAALTIITAGCNDSSSSHEHNHEHSNECSHSQNETKHNEQDNHAEAPKTVTVPKATQQVMGLKTQCAQMRAISSMRSIIGRYELCPHARTTVATPVAGKITLFVKALDKVKKGDKIFTITSPDLVARSHEIAALKKRLSVYKEINTTNAELENSIAVKEAERKAILAGAEEDNGTITIRANADGFIESLDAISGDWLETGNAALKITNKNALRFCAIVTASDAQELNSAKTAKVGSLTGQISFGIGQDNGLIPLYVTFNGDIDAIAGAKATAECTISSSDIPEAIVPSKSIITIGVQPTVFVKDINDECRFIAIDVTPTMSSGGWTAVDGLPYHGVEVVTDGAYELKLALASQGAPSSGHFHADGTFHDGEH